MPSDGPNGTSSRQYATSPTNEPQPASPTPPADDERTPPLPLPLPTLVSTVHAQVTTFLNTSFPSNSPISAAQAQTRRSLEIISAARSRYALHELSLSYNGGKDCLVLLILFLASLHPLPSSSGGSGDADAGHAGGGGGEEEGEEEGEALESIPAIYALPPDPFPSVEEFVAYSARTYHLSVQKYTTSPPESTLRSCFQDYLSLNPRIKAIFVGTRRTDPHGAKLTHFDRTDRGWPDFVRINPMLDWHYAEIWAFIRHLGLRYCDLYDQGYTSLGGRRDTNPNPKLRIDGDQGRYRPAYELMEDLEERLGRD